MYACFNSRALGLGLWNAFDSIAMAVESGFEGVDLLVRDLVESGVALEDVRSRMRDAGLRAGAWPFPFDWRRDEESYREGLRRLPEYARAASALGLTRTATWVLPMAPPGMSDPEQVADWHRRRLGPIARVLDDSGIRLGLEAIAVRVVPFDGVGADFARSLPEASLRLRSLLNEHANVGWLWDSFHAALAEDEWDAAAAWGADRIVWVHIANPPLTSESERRALRDDQREVPDQGETRYSRWMLDRLRRAGYAGPVTPEPLTGGSSIALDATDRRACLDRAQGARFALLRVWPG